jgi:hypothetical protein
VTAAWHPDPVLEPRFRWSFPETRQIDPDLVTAALDHGLAERMTALLARRGVLGRDDLVRHDDLNRRNMKQYVANIYKYYLAYKMVTEHPTARGSGPEMATKGR